MLSLAGQGQILASDIKWRRSEVHQRRCSAISVVAESPDSNERIRQFHAVMGGQPTAPDRATRLGLASSRSSSSPASERLSLVATT